MQLRTFGLVVVGTMEEPSGAPVVGIMNSGKAPWAFPASPKEIPSQGRSACSLHYWLLQTESDDGGGLSDLVRWCIGWM